MKRRSSPIARLLAVAALAGAFIVLVVVVSAALDDGGSDGGGKSQAHQEKRHEEAPKNIPAVYVVKGGDTLTAIAHSTGVNVATIERLNPEIDPQILNVGEKIKLK